MDWSTRMRNGLHHAHAGVDRLTHGTGHMLHDRTFWICLAVAVGIVAVIAAAVVWSGKFPTAPGIPVTPYGPYL